jgi:hypothetical protein
MESLKPVYLESAVAITFLAVLIIAATVKRRSWLIGYMAVILTVMAFDKWSSLWAITTIINSGTAYEDQVVRSLVIKERLYFIAFSSFIIYLLSDFIPSLIKNSIKGLSRTITERIERW